VNLLDWILVALVAGFFLSGLLKGIVRQAFSLGGIVAGHLAGVRWHGQARSLLKIDFPGGDAAAYVAVFLAVYLLARLLGALAEQRVRSSALSGGDRLLGGLLGLVTGAALAVLLVFVAASVLPPDASLVRGSRLAPRAERAARWASPLLPEKVRSPFLSRPLLGGGKGRGGERGGAPEEGSAPRRK
jgi:membrane protein required for colicin V production